jgi:hypothetical protein
VVGKPESLAAGADPTVAREVFYGDGTTITRYGVGQVLGVRL